MGALQWGGRFSAAPDRELLSFASSLSDDLVLARYDVQCSLGHVEALVGGGIVSKVEAQLLRRSLHLVLDEIASGAFEQLARSSSAEDVHGLIDERVRELAGPAGERLHAGRSRNDQVATTLLLYAHDRGLLFAEMAENIAAILTGRAADELEAETMLAGATHWQPAQPVLLAFVLAAWAEPFVRAAQRFAAVAESATASCPLGSGALSGSTLPLDRQAAAAALGFRAPSRNALDAVGNRDAILDLAHAGVRAAVDASRIAEELVLWTAPAFGYARLGDAASTGSSLMPQKRNPDPFELVRARAAKLTGLYAGALATMCGLATSYHRDLQETKAAAIAVVEEALGVLSAFARAWRSVSFDRDRMSERAELGFTVATDVADALIADGVTARTAHAAVGAAVARAEEEGRALGAADLARIAQDSGLRGVRAPLGARESIAAKRTAGSTAPAEVRKHLTALRARA